MPDEAGRFQTKGLSWAERAKLGGLRAVISPSASVRNNAFLGGVHGYGADWLLDLLPPEASVVDFGCGNGRFTRFFAEHGHTVVGTEITPEMIAGLESTERCRYELTDGIRIPCPDASIDGIWCCGVLRFSLFVPEPVHDQIATEMMRVLKPGGVIINVEVFVDQPARAFTKDFIAAGLRAHEPRILHRYAGSFEHHAKNPRIPDGWMPWLGTKLAQMRYHIDSHHRQPSGLRDYLFQYEKRR